MLQSRRFQSLRWFFSVFEIQDTQSWFIAMKEDAQSWCIAMKDLVYMTDFSYSKVLTVF
ncbi:hypothetical protein HanPSC8_Chr03g0107241 [Helianthus annuus]|nr:hypothetical protein HanPSC8_Chr03g0107241 [Helianthus annuus]